MKKFWISYRILGGGAEFTTEEAAITDAKRRQFADKDGRYAVMEAKHLTLQPVPAISIEPVQD